VSAPAQEPVRVDQDPVAVEVAVETERTVVVDQSDPNRGRVDRARMGRRNPADTEPRPPIPAEDIEATRAELHRRMTRRTVQ
jgi:hypothetical protein